MNKSLAKKKSEGNPHVIVPADVIRAVFMGALTAKTMQIPKRMLILRSTSCRCSGELATAAKTNDKGHNNRPIKIILPQKNSRFEKVDQSPNKGVKTRALSQRHPQRKARK